ncbi:restriction endonuclease subunit S [Thermicanus aegyptius]|uniref:restriction endonuclease subunit S n=1 Tax=Thermicanus aegyptius TaxID=94009 RepID=UPI0003FCA820|nr:restriction endonuclease subunit S [Thermicanus aegyptius]
MSFSEWRETKLDEVLNFYNGKKRPTESGNIPVYGGNGILNYCSSYNTEGESLIIGRVGAYCGNVFYENNKCWISDNAILAKAKENISCKFMYYKLKHLNLHDMRIGSSQPLLTQGILKSLTTTIPQLPEQKAIAATLSALDDMIELNNQINKTLEEIAQAIFKSWFVDFEPFKDGEFEESELGLIPKGWRVGTLSSIGDIIGGGTPSKSKPEYYVDSGIPWITPKDLSMNKNKYISRGQFDISELGLRESSAKLMPKGTVLFSSRAPIGYIAIAKNAVTTNQGFKSIVPFNNISSEYVYLLLKNNVGEIESRASGSTFKEISGGEMKKVPIILPPMDVINQFNEIATTLGKVQALLEDENHILSSIRDTLLPKLMSGEIRVPMEEVV